MSDGILTIILLGAAVYVTRVVGYLMGGQAVAGSRVERVASTLPGAALAAVIAIAAMRGSLTDLLAICVTAAIFAATGRTLVAMGAGLVVILASAHLGIGV
ncbi:MAG: AzlD domain-containing protein [Devosia sp.]